MKKEVIICIFLFSLVFAFGCTELLNQSGPSIVNPIAYIELKSISPDEISAKIVPNTASPFKVAYSPLFLKTSEPSKTNSFGLVETWTYFSKEEQIENYIKNAYNQRCTRGSRIGENKNYYYCGYPLAFTFERTTTDGEIMLDGQLSMSIYITEEQLLKGKITGEEVLSKSHSGDNTSLDTVHEVKNIYSLIETVNRPKETEVVKETNNSNLNSTATDIPATDNCSGKTCDALRNFGMARSDCDIGYVLYWDRESRIEILKVIRKDIFSNACVVEYIETREDEEYNCHKEVYYKIGVMNGAFIKEVPYPDNGEKCQTHW